MIEVVLIALGALIIGGGIMVLFSQDITGSIVAAGLISLFASIVFLLLGAPDVAMTEAAIGSGLTTVVFLFAWSRIRKATVAHEAHGDSDTAGGLPVDPAGAGGTRTAGAGKETRDA